VKILIFAAILAAILGAQPAADPRLVDNGPEIPHENYVDQPYVVITDDGNWLCLLTTGIGKEGQNRQHIVSTISRDRGKTWSPLVDIEPADGPEASWVMPLKVPGGRVYAFYNYNRDNLRVLPNVDDDTMAHRVDTMGSYMFKYSDDNGRTWSKERYEIPMRKMRIDRENNTKGDILNFWGVGKPVIAGKYAIFGFAKVGRWGSPGGMVESQGCFLRSDNILTERDPRKIRWELLPDGDEGLRAPKGPVSDEANPVVMNDGSLYATYRTIDGYSAAAYSRDGGHTWTPSAYAVYSPGGQLIKHNRAANFVKKFSNGKYILWYNNHGGEITQTLPRWNAYLGRNPNWIAGGIEKNGIIYWSQPEIVLYTDDPKVGSSYPDFIEQDGHYYITETQKTVARVHEIDPSLLNALWNHAENRNVAKKGLVLESNAASGSKIDMPPLPDLSTRRGFAIDFWMNLRELSPGQIVLDARRNQKGIALLISDHSTLQLVLNDGKQSFAWDSDPGIHPGTLRVNVWQHVSVIVDGAAKVVSFVVDGTLNDGGAVRDYGFGRFPLELGDVNGLGSAVFGVKIAGTVEHLRIYDRYLLTSEALGNWRAGR
jgi:hypothetical protein